MGLNPEPVQVVWTHDGDAPLACYSPHPPEITLNAVHWPSTSRQERERAVAHELGHHDTGTAYLWTDDPTHQITIDCLEAKADRAGLKRLISDDRVWAAQRDGCHELYEFAEYWRCDEATALARLRVAMPYLFGVY